MNTSLSVIDRSNRQKIHKDRVELRRFISQLDVTDIYIVLHPTTQNTDSSQAHTDHSPTQTISWSVKHPPSPPKNKNHTTPPTPSWLPSSCPLLPQLGSPPIPSPPGSFPNPSRMAFKRAGWAFISCTELCSQQSLAMAPPWVGSAFHASFQSGFGGSSPDAQPDLGNPLTCLLLRNVSFCSLVFPALFTSDSTW